MTSTLDSLAPTADASYLSPPLEWRDRAAWIFDRFYLHSHTTECINCASVTHYSEVYRGFRRREKPIGLAYDTAIRKAPAPASEIDARLPVVIVSLPPKQIPICHLCLSGSRESRVRLVAISDAEFHAAERALRERQAEELRASPPSRPREPRITPASDADLLSF